MHERTVYNKRQNPSETPSRGDRPLDAFIGIKVFNVPKDFWKQGLLPYIMDKKFAQVHTAYKSLIL